MSNFLDTAYLSSFLTAATCTAIPFAYAALGEIYSEKAGILNIGLEANMLMGAFASFAITYITGSSLLGLLAGMAGGMLVCLIHAFVSIRLKQNQTICGIALNTMVLGITSYLRQVLASVSGGTLNIKTIPKLAIPVLSDIPLIGEALFYQDILVYLLYALIAASCIFLYKTQWGDTLAAVGEDPRTADTVGIHVDRTQFLAATLNGMLSGLSGSYMTLVTLGSFAENLTAGRGFIALAVVIFGRRHPIKTFLAALLFGASETLQFRLQAMNVPLPTQFLSMLPYLITVIVLLCSAGKQRDPENLGKPYIRDAR